MAEKTVQQKNNKTKNKNYIFAIGRRKSAIARVRLYENIPDGLSWNSTTVNKGDIIVNEKPIADYFGGDLNRYNYSAPLRVANAQNKYTFTVRVVGGGQHGQLEAVVAGIANALDSVDSEKYHTPLKLKNLLTRDARVRERRKVGTGGKARRKMQSPKR